jgi:fucose permease
MTCPLLIAFALKHNQISLTLLGCSGFGVVMVVGLLFASFGADERPYEAKAAEAGSAAPAFHIGFVLACLFFIYVSMENGIGIWAAEFSRRLANGITGMTTLAPTFFYGGLTLGRASAPLALRHLKERTLALGALALAAAGNTLLILSPGLFVAIASVFFAGLGCASIYPIYIAWLSRWYGARAKKIGGVLFALASLGGSIGPWLVGAVSQFSGSLRIGLLVPLVSALIMIGLVQLLRKQTTA